MTDRALAEPNADRAVIASTEFNIRFAKSTMFRSLLSKTTKSDYLKWFKDVEVYWSEAMVPPEEAEEGDQIVPRCQSSVRRRRTAALAVPSKLFSWRIQTHPRSTRPLDYWRTIQWFFSSHSFW